MKERHIFANGAGLYVMPATPAQLKPAVIECPFCKGDECGCCWCDHCGRIDVARFGMDVDDIRAMADAIHGVVSA